MSATELGIFWLSGFRAVEVPVWANHPIVLSLFPIFYLGDVCRIASVVSHQSHPQKEYPDAFKHHAKTCPVYTQHLTLKKRKRRDSWHLKLRFCDLWFSWFLEKVDDGFILITFFHLFYLNEGYLKAPVRKKLTSVSSFRNLGSWYSTK